MAHHSMDKTLALLEYNVCYIAIVMIITTKSASEMFAMFNIYQSVVHLTIK